MKRVIKKICAAGALGSLMLGVGGCADNENMLVIVGVQAASADCKYSDSCSSTLLIDGSTDVSFGGGLGFYNAVLLVSNELTMRGSKARLRGESSDIFVNNAEVTLLQNGQAAFANYSVFASGLVRVGSGEDVNCGSVALHLLPGVAIPDGTSSIIAETRLQGTTSGGQDIESNLFRFEILVGSLVDYNAVDPDTGVPTCDRTLCPSNSTKTYCSLGQDTRVSCCDLL